MPLFQARSAAEIFKLRLFYLITIPALLAGSIILFFFLRIRDFPVFPNHHFFEYSFFSDSTYGGDSRIIRQLVTDTVIQFDFKIGNKINAPYVGLNIEPTKSRSVEMGLYNQLQIKLEGDGINGIGIALVTLNHLNQNDLESKEVLFYHIFKCSPEASAYELSIDNFEIPDWWGEVNLLEDAPTIKPELKNLQTINVSSAFTPNKGQIQSIIISSILFSRNNQPLIVLILALEFVFVILVFVILYAMNRIKEHKKTITISYRPIENNIIDNAKSDLIGFINHNFQSSELTLQLVASETGVSQRRVTSHIQHQFGCNFKSYINRLRINESKRLLLEKDLNIGEIAYQIGFNNQTHFNRVFKSEMQISPTEFRKKYKADLTS
jgi:AraC-like DNA-binding protein